MVQRNLKDIWVANWNNSNVNTPSFIEEPYESRFIYNRCLSSKRIRKIEDYMGIIKRSHYTPESHDAWMCYVVSDNEQDALAMIDEARRICSQFQSTAEEAVLQWEGGDWDLFQPYRYEFNFIVFVRRSGRQIPNV